MEAIIPKKITVNDNQIVLIIFGDEVIIETRYEKGKNGGVFKDIEKMTRKYLERLRLFLNNNEKIAKDKILEIDSITMIDKKHMELEVLRGTDYCTLKILSYQDTIEERKERIVLEDKKDEIRKRIDKILGSYYEEYKKYIRKRGF